jgi:excisionase family DNA binding protein
MPTIVVHTDDLLALDDATHALGIGIATLYRWIKSGKITPLRLGHRTLIPKTEVDRLQGK